VADRPLRPATDRRLGRPLPHQQANRTQATPKAPYGFVPQDICGISPSFPGLSPTSGHIPTRYSPVRHSPCRACDLHVLSIPPAFALSQDQTLRFIHPAGRNPPNEYQPISPKSRKPDALPARPINSHQAPAPHKTTPTKQPLSHPAAPPAHPTPPSGKARPPGPPSNHQHNPTKRTSRQTERTSKTRCSFQWNETPTQPSPEARPAFNPAG
jgi:hypothetical protein